MSGMGHFRAIEDSELERMRTWRNSPAVRANMYTRHEISASEHLAWWERTRGREDQQYFMYERSGAPLGIVGFTAIDPANRNCSWAFYSAQEAPRGTGSRMEFLALEHAFGTMGLHKLHCEVLAFNTSVVGLHQKFGFAIEGTLREHHRMDGEYVDIIRLGLLASEWVGKRDEMQAKLTSARQER